MTARADKKLAAATMVRRMDQWAQELYGTSLLDADSKAREVKLGDFMTDIREREFEVQVRQIPGQTKIKADETTGEVEIEEDTSAAEASE